MSRLKNVQVTTPIAPQMGCAADGKTRGPTGKGVAKPQQPLAVAQGGQSTALQATARQAPCGSGRARKDSKAASDGRFSGRPSAAASAADAAQGCRKRKADAGSPVKATPPGRLVCAKREAPAYKDPTQAASAPCVLEVNELPAMSDYQDAPRCCEEQAVQPASAISQIIAAQPSAKRAQGKADRPGRAGKRHLKSNLKGPELKHPLMAGPPAQGLTWASRASQAAAVSSLKGEPGVQPERPSSKAQVRPAQRVRLQPSGANAIGAQAKGRTNGGSAASAGLEQPQHQDKLSTPCSDNIYVAELAAVCKTAEVRRPDGATTHMFSQAHSVMSCYVMSCHVMGSQRSLKLDIAHCSTSWVLKGGCLSPWQSYLLTADIEGLDTD